jgi:hypothetical protein
VKTREARRLPRRASIEIATLHGERAVRLLVAKKL